MTTEPDSLFPIPETPLPRLAAARKRLADLDALATEYVKVEVTREQKSKVYFTVLKGQKPSRDDIKRAADDLDSLDWNDDPFSLDWNPPKVVDADEAECYSPLDTTESERAAALAELKAAELEALSK